MGIYYADELGNQAALIKMIHDDVNSAFSPDQSVSNFRSSARLLHGCRRKSRLYVAPPSLVRFTNRPFGHQRRYTKRFRVGAANGWESNQLEAVFNRPAVRQFNQQDELYIAGALANGLANTERQWTVLLHCARSSVIRHFTSFARIEQGILPARYQ